MKKRAVLLFAKRGDKEAKEAAKVTASWLKKQDCRIIDVTETEDPISAERVKEVCLGVVYGGDGTFLTLVRRLEKKDAFPLMGVNLGSLGFITEINKEEVGEAVETVLTGNFSEDHRPLLHVELIRKGKVIDAGEVFNDAVISKDARTSLLVLSIEIDGDLLSQVRADGYLMATPTGSTGYSLSSGGALLHPKVKAMILRPISAHSLTVRSIIVPQKMTVDIVLHEFHGPVYLIRDGLLTLAIKPEDRIRVKLSETSLRMISSQRLTWPDILRAKLHMS